MKPSIRHINAEEYAEARQIWDECFPEDASGYSAYYFDKRTRIENVLAAFDGENMLAALHAIPYKMRIGETIKNAVMVAGVATREKYRGQGIASELIMACHEEQRLLGTAAAVLKPDVDFYTRLGYVPFALHDEYRLNWLDAGYTAPIHAAEAEELLKIYSEYAQSFVGMMVRSKADMEAYIEETRVCGGHAYSTGKAYALLNPTEYGADIYELAGEDKHTLINALAEEFGSVSFRLARTEAPDTAAVKTGECVFSMICPLNEALFIEDTGAKSAKELINGVLLPANTLEFC